MFSSTESRLLDRIDLVYPSDRTRTDPDRLHFRLRGGEGALLVALRPYLARCTASHYGRAVR